MILENHYDRGLMRSMVAGLGRKWNVSYEEAHVRISKWLDSHPNPNTFDRRTGRELQKATGRDAELHGEMLKKNGGIPPTPREYVHRDQEGRELVF